MEETGSSENTPMTGADHIVGDDAGYDIRSLQDISVAESIAEEKAEAAKAKPQSKPILKTDPKEKPPVTGTPSIGEEAAEIADEAVEETPEGTEDDGAVEETVEDGEEAASDKDNFQFKAGEKTLKVPKDAEVTITVNGKPETMKLADALSIKSGEVHIARETSRLGRERKDFETKRSAFEAESQQVAANAQALLECQDAFEFCELYGALKGVEPQKVWEELTQKTIQAITMIEKMTPQERALMAENRRVKAQNKQFAAKQKVETETQTTRQQREALESDLKAEHLTMKDWMDSLEEMQEKLRNKESLGEDFDNLEKFTPEDVTDYAVERAIRVKRTEAISAVNKNLLKDTNFVSKLDKAIYKTERLHGPMTKAEVIQFVKAATDSENKRVRESLSKKASVTQKAKSKIATSRKQAEEDDDDDAGPITPGDYFESRRITYPG